MLAIEVNGLSKAYGDFVCLKSCDLEVPTGIVFGLLGPNGAGKSTLLRTLLGFLSPTSGEARVCGFDIRSQSLAVRGETSYLPGDARLYRAMKGSGVLSLFSGLHRHGSLERSKRVAQHLDLDLSRRVMFMSTGMRQKLALAIVLGCAAPLVVLDEPTANLDPNVRATVLELIREVRDEGRTVVLSSHIFSDIDETTDRVAILRQGAIVASETMGQLSQTHIVQAVLEHAVPPEQFKHACNQQTFVDYFVTRSEPAERGAGLPRVELHLAGSPQGWLEWLGKQPLRDVVIERAGIRALYQRYHFADKEGQAGNAPWNGDSQSESA